MSKFIAHTLITKTGFKLTPYNKAALMAFAQKNEGEGKLTIETRKRKSKDALGFYWGGVLPAIIAHNKNLLRKDELKHNPFRLAELIKDKKITKDEIDILHRDIMITFRPELSKDLRTNEIFKTGQLLRENNNEYLIELITEIMEEFETQGYEFGDPEVYKKFRDNPKIKS